LAPPLPGGRSLRHLLRWHFSPQAADSACPASALGLPSGAPDRGGVSRGAVRAWKSSSSS
jgi:hypothetical protein